jgi:hypothetical protein
MTLLSQFPFLLCKYYTEETRQACQLASCPLEKKNARHKYLNILFLKKLIKIKKI